ncbi:hypothetical protein ACFYXH_41755 [Streptomyces sp. NPDC002730]|uniref:hypothetical protein n=1 Tax=Streptomyces sp. NPDC002730 TaxID=3364662 RepID=UPI0036B9CFB4
MIKKYSELPLSPRKFGWLRLRYSIESADVERWTPDRPGRLQSPGDLVSVQVTAV